MNNSIAPDQKAAFTHPETIPGPLSARTAASLLAAVGEVALVLSADGTIVDVAVPPGDLAHHGFTAWIGDAWADTVTIESKPKVAEMLADAASNGIGAGAAPRWRQVNHPAAGGDVPVRYLVMALGDDAGGGAGDGSGGGAGNRGRLIAIGRDMRAAAVAQQRLLQTQQSLERDYIRLRQAETRYRLLFDSAAEPVLIVDPATRRIREANPAAHRLLDVAEGSLVGEQIGALVDAGDRDAFIAHLGAAEAVDKAATITLQLARQRGDARFTARLFRQARTPLLLVQIAAAGPVDADHRHDATLHDVIERMPDGFVLADGDLIVLAANAAFVELIGAASADRVVGAALGSWFGRPGIDLDLIVGQLREHGAVRNVATILRGAAGEDEEIEVSGVAAPIGDGICYGFTVRHVGRRLRAPPVVDRDMPRSVEQLTELVGRVSLKDIVRESTDLVERLCIEAALAYTSDNRASAAEILGVSRQSLYSKLHRHGLGNLVPGNE